MSSEPPLGPAEDDVAPSGGFVANYLLYLLAAASEGASGQFHSHVRAKGLRVPEWRVLACLNDRDGEMITRLARISLFEQSRLTRIIAQMDERGLVRRLSDPKDGRKVRVFLTDAGRAIAAELVPQAQAHEAALLRQISRDHAAALKPALHDLLAAMEREEDCPAGRP